ncbi:RES domain-containing protein [Muricomes intestini]|uniref:RES domain-containing protein n=1 Tax=Muricomes intestini TaxID=1796634 RepID=A0A4R3K005_9FIRM|nr:RES family NAD+ phosphorylase [Muricomes intestini]TCS75022.1 RES domain-containing protein [Muricomes intestini]
MVFCERCFCDTEVISVIRSKAKIGECPLCHSKNVHIYDTAKYKDLSILFDDLLSIYTPVSQLPASYPKSETSLLKSELINSWNIFNKRSESDVYNIIIAICKEKYEYNAELFDQPVGIQELYDESYLMKHSLLTTNSWDDFVNVLKTKNRFHTRYIDVNLLERFCSYVRKPYKAGTAFYRCRISSEDGIIGKEMGAPPVQKTTDGRANARGIRCLYLGNIAETTIYETRAGAYDYVTVGKFELKKDIIVVDLKKINQISPFIEGLDCLECAINKAHLNKINDEMGKVMRRSDSALDYLPTQYIADFVKSIVHDGLPEYAGIEYKSVMYSEGYNLAVFNPDLFECIGTDVYRIDTIHYNKHILE